MSSKYTTCFFCIQTLDDSSQNNSNKIFQINNKQIHCLKLLLTHLTNGEQSNKYPLPQLNDILKLWISCSYLLESSGDIYISRLCINCNSKVQKFMELQLELDFIRGRITNLVKNIQGLIVGSKFNSIGSTDQNIQNDVQEFQEAVCSSVNTTHLKSNLLEAFDTQPEVQLSKSPVANNLDESEDVVSFPNSPNISTPDNTQDQIVCNSEFNGDSDICDFTDSPRAMNKIMQILNIKPVNPVVIRRYCCGQCQDEDGNHKAFETESGLRQHIEEQHRPKSFKCQVCGATFSQRYSLRAHQRIHTGNGFKCKVCGKLFAHKIQCVKHEKYVHSEETTVACKICGKGFRDPRSLSEHKFTHTEDRLFECLLCKRKFKTGKVLKNHLRAHTGERKYPCDVCGFRLTTKGSMQKHRKIKHPEVEIHK